VAANRAGAERMVAVTSLTDALRSRETGRHGGNMVLDVVHS
jgi:hypothetical protein